MEKDSAGESAGLDGLHMVACMAQESAGYNVSTDPQGLCAEKQWSMGVQQVNKAMQWCCYITAQPEYSKQHARSMQQQSRPLLQHCCNVRMLNCFARSSPAAGWHQHNP
jgi:hypothetical protein